MQFKTDIPITSYNEDLLNRSSFVKQLSSSIYNFNLSNRDNTSSLVLGLYGEWGCGKTSIINMIEEELESLYKDDTSKYQFLRFNPWNYSTYENLIVKFFEFLTDNVGLKSNKKKNRLGRLLIKYSSYFNVVETMPIPGSTLISKTLIELFRGIGTALNKEESLEELKRKIEDELAKLDKKIIIVIDVLDIIPDVQINDMFQLLKQVGDFPNIVYLLAMDKKVVFNALSTVHKGIDGNRYLDKIVQVPIQIPEIRPNQLFDILILKVCEILTKYNYDTTRLKTDTYQNYISRTVLPFIKNVRDINKLLNIFEFRFASLADSVIAEQLLVINAIELFEPKLYKWIKVNKNTLCDNSHSYRPYYFYEEKEYLMANFSNAEELINILAILFPDFSSVDVQAAVYYALTAKFNDISFEDKIISNEHCFDRYFFKY